jgi:hypothetical protein
LIHFGEISRETREAWTALGHKQGWLDETDDLRLWIDLETAAALYFRLRNTEDLLEYFPRGKSASLQRLELIIDNSVEQEKMGR